MRESKASLLAHLHKEVDDPQGQNDYYEDGRGNADDYDGTDHREESEQEHPIGETRYCTE